MAAWGRARGPGETVRGSRGRGRRRQTAAPLSSGWVDVAGPTMKGGIFSPVNGSGALVRDGAVGCPAGGAQISVVTEQPGLRSAPALSLPGKPCAWPHRPARHLSPPHPFHRPTSSER